MKIRLISYSKRGRDTARDIAAALEAEGHECRRFALPKHLGEGDEPLTVSGSEWAGEGFKEADALVFCCAAGIAVRAIAPWVKDKTTDPAVVVTDEKGIFAVPVLSGHIGGANELAIEIARVTGGTPVVTTATDVNGLFAVDVFAEKNGLYITDMKLAKEVSAALVAGKKVAFRSDIPWKGELPACLSEEPQDIGVYVSAKDGPEPFEKTLRLVPRRFAAGVGCRRGKPEEDLERFVSARLKECGVSPRELRCIASIDIKKDEQGLIALAEKLGVPFVTYSAEELMRVPGEFTTSEFVRSQTGVDSVCERAAVRAACGKLKVKKQAADGMTFALAEYEEALRFE